MKFIVFVEGQTEHRALPAFLKRWLDPRLREPVGVQTVRFEGWPELVRETPARAARFLSAPGGDVLAVFALLDLYGLRLPYPADVTDATARVAWAAAHLEARAGDARFRQFFAVHEIEAWLLSDPAIFAHDLRGDLLPKGKEPERVNSDEPPAKLLERLYLSKTGKTYKKVTDGERLFAKLNPETAYTKCPGLRAMLDAMLALAET